MASQFQRLSFRHIIIIGNYTFGVNFENEHRTLYAPLQGVNTSSASALLITMAPFSQEPNLTGGVSTFAAFRGMNITSITPDRIFDLSIEIQVANSTYYNILITSSAVIPTLVNHLYLSIMVFNTNFFNQQNFANYQVGSISGTTSSTHPLEYSNPGNVPYFSTVFGLRKFHVEQDSFFDIEISINGSDSFVVQSQNQPNSFTVDYILFFTYYCPYQNPYHYSRDNTCLVECPPRTFINLATLTCEDCPYDCYTCDTSYSCLSCNASTDYRVLSGSSCVPLPGYF